MEPLVIVPVSRLDRATLRALSFARSIDGELTAVHVTDDLDEGEQLRRRWVRAVPDIPLVIIESPYRVLLTPLLAYIADRDKHDPSQPITIVLAEFVPRHFWEYVLHNQTAFRLKLQLFFRPNTVVIDVPYYMEMGRGEHESPVGEESPARNDR
jgi:hypothetical protein